MTEETIEGFLGRPAAREPVPGGGAVAVLEAALIHADHEAFAAAGAAYALPRDGTDAAVRDEVVDALTRADAVVADVRGVITGGRSVTTGQQGG